MSRPIRTQPYVPPDLGRGRSRKQHRLGLALATAALIGLLGIAGYMALQVRWVTFEVEPVTATVQLQPDSLTYQGRWMLWPGTYEVSVSAQGYWPRQMELVVNESSPERVHVELAPMSGALRVRTRPAVEGEVWLNGSQAGAVDALIEGLDAGTYNVEVRARGYYPGEASVDVRGLGQLEELEIALKEVEVTPVSTVTFSSEPAGAELLIDGSYRGRAPQTITKDAGGTLQVTVLAPGYESAQVKWILKEGTHQHTLRLKPRLGAVELFPVPANATIRIDGKVEVRRNLNLPQRGHIVEVSAPGHASQTHAITPHPDALTRLNVQLLPEAIVATSRRRKVEQEMGLNFVTFRPYESFAIKTTRRKIPVRLTRPFAILDKEVSNALFRKYRAAHSSGDFKKRSLDGEQQPVVQLDWNDAALFANWLSEQTGVMPFYRVTGDAVTGFDASSLGYRLPTEAEWVWLTKREERFAWGDSMPPPNRFANMADSNATELFPDAPREYSDGFAVSAPVGSFKPVTQGKLYDLPGNVAEWMHDVYGSGLTVVAGEGLVNPLGEAQGKHHVIRGFSWRSSGQKALSLTHRRYDSKGRDDVGFRLAYYLDSP